MTEDGHVECDASIMDGDSGAFGAVGAVPGNRSAEYYLCYCECYIVPLLTVSWILILTAYVVDQVSEMPSRLLLYWQKSK